MDASGRHDMHGVASTSGTPASRKRAIPRENETPSQRQKREKAAERQRRKRERDRLASQGALNGLSGGNGLQSTAHNATQTPDYLLTPEEQARRERVRAAARERQRKHRALVKQKKLEQLGLDMGNEIMPGMEGGQYVDGVPAGFEQMIPPDVAGQPPPPPPQHGGMGQHEPPFPHGQPLGGQTFASTLLLSFSCAPLLKQHLLRSLSMTNEELASLEPVIAHAWDQWDQQRRMHYAEQAKAAGGTYEHPVNHGYTDPSQPPPTDFRARFHRPLVAPSPFQQAPATTSSPPSNSATGQQSSDPIDPNLTGQQEQNKG
ncbi:hypothetical protein NEOLEDRAFT_1117260 [Neolentinus lepideus HHB14362 ss-1]|uniref:Uncharacterized protein n=1 Tax=Neolentinus lepideus HHB14362 ss-1 TaxID=1314782 RepID=A0A165RLF7_9AGAM|nr:hypothetical protein NEOLEDRAFT_1117260 [Neolentinus lepideus HHB14362 ss-1]